MKENRFDILKRVEEMKILITGAASGIGYDLGCALIKKGHYVYFTTHKREELEPLKQKLQSQKVSQKNYQCLSFDITSRKERKEIGTDSLDCLICNGALGLGGTLFDLEEKQIKQVFEVNVFSNLELIKEYLTACFTRKKQGRVIVMTSMAGVMPVPLMDAYCASKAALISFLTNLARESLFCHWPYVIKIVEPGIYQTGFNEFMLSTVPQNSSFSTTKLQKREQILFRWISKKNNRSIVKKIIQAVHSSSPRLIYRAPLSERILLKLYLLFFG